MCLFCDKFINLQYIKTVSINWYLKSLFYRWQEEPLARPVKDAVRQSMIVLLWGLETYPGTKIAFSVRIVTPNSSIPVILKKVGYSAEWIMKSKLMLMQMRSLEKDIGRSASEWKEDSKQILSERWTFSEGRTASVLKIFLFFQPQYAVVRRFDARQGQVL